MAAIDKVRVLVVGDSGVGKTSLVHLICHSAPIGNPYWTIGCSVDVKLHEYKVGTPAEKTFFVELWDVGGWSAHANSRSIFYNPVHGIILVHDITNRKSQQNLRKWLAEVLNKESKDTREDLLSGRAAGRSPALPRKSPGGGSVGQRRDLVHRVTTRGSYDPEQFADSHIPMLVIGTKLDLAETVRNSSMKRGSSIAEECGADELSLDCTQVKHLAPGSGNAVRLSRFFDKVIERKFYSGREPAGVSNQVMGSYTDRRRPLSASANYLKSSHVD